MTVRDVCHYFQHLVWELMVEVHVSAFDEMPCVRTHFERRVRVELVNSFPLQLRPEEHPNRVACICEVAVLLEQRHLPFLILDSC